MKYKNIILRVRLAIVKYLYNGNMSIQSFLEKAAICRLCSCRSCNNNV